MEIEMKDKILKIIEREKSHAVDNLERARMECSRAKDSPLMETYLTDCEFEVAEIIDCINWVKDR